MDGRLTLAFRRQEETELFSPSTVQRFKGWTRELDISHNRVTNVHLLKDFQQLQVLILDSNPLGDTCVFPRLPRVQTLWCNFCNIANLSSFLERVALAFPDLQRLSLIGNPCCPNFLLEGSTPQKYAYYRLQCISMLTSLVHLDDAVVDAVERAEAQRTFQRGPREDRLTKQLRQQKARAKKKKKKKERAKVELEEDEGEVEHPYARAESLEIKGLVREEDEWTTDEESIEYFENYKPGLQV